MSVYNGERFLADAIRSILAQSFGDFEFLILDDGSTDSSRSIIAGFAASDSRIRPIIRENRGLIASLNQLLEEARAPLIARMDADDISHPERFSRQISFLAGHPDHGVLGTWNQDMAASAQARAGLSTASVPHLHDRHCPFPHHPPLGGNATRYSRRKDHQPR